jgi:hypothetical protein
VYRSYIPKSCKSLVFRSEKEKAEFRRISIWTNHRSGILYVEQGKRRRMVSRLCQNRFYALVFGLDSQMSNKAGTKFRLASRFCTFFYLFRHTLNQKWAIFFG